MPLKISIQVMDSSEALNLNEDIIAIIPAYNEERKIGDVVKRCLSFTNKVLVVDDGSLDSTSKLAKASGAVVISHKVNRGKGTALRTAIKTLRDFLPEVVVLIDADGQDDPNYIPRLVAPILQGNADFVIGSRFTEGGVAGIPGHKIIGNKILTFITNLISGYRTKLTESQCGFRAIKYDKLLDLNLIGKGFEIDSEIIIEAIKSRLRVTEVPIRDKVVTEAIEKGTTILDGIKVVLSLFRLHIQKLFL